jgi:hypothetical protein
MIGPAAFQEAQIVGVIDDAGEVGVFVIDPHLHVVPAVADFAVEMSVGSRRHRVGSMASGNTWSRVSGA